MKLEIKQYSLPVKQGLDKIVDTIIAARGVIDGEAVSMIIGELNYLVLIDEFYGCEKLKEANEDNWIVYEYVKVPDEYRYKLKIKQLYYAPVWWISLCSEELKI